MLIFFVTGSCVIKRWTQLRDTWKKSLDENKKTKKSGSGAKSRPYKYDQELIFLKPIIKPGETHDNNPNTRDEIQRENDHEQANQTETRSESSSKKKKVDSSSELDNKMMKLVDYQLNTIGHDDRNLNFFKSVLPSLRFFDDDKILEFQSGVINLIQSIKTGPNHSNLPQNYNVHNYNNEDYYTRPPEQSPARPSNNNLSQPLSEHLSIANATASPNSSQPGRSLSQLESISRNDARASPEATITQSLSQLSDYLDLSNF